MRVRHRPGVRRHRLQRLGHAARAAHGRGRPRRGAGPGAAAARAAAARRWPAAPTPGCTRGARSRTSTCRPTRWRRRRAAATATRWTALRHRLSGVLAPDLVVRRVSAAPPGFDARFAALRRRYAYRIVRRRRGRLDPLRRREVLVVRGPLDVAAMNAASASLLGLQRLRRVLQAARGRDDGADPAGATRGRATDALLVGDRRRRRVLPLDGPGPGGRGARGRPRPAPGRVAGGGADRPACATRPLPSYPPHGLCLEEVTYPGDDLLAARVAEARARRSPHPADAAQVEADGPAEG